MLPKYLPKFSIHPAIKINEHAMMVIVATFVGLAAGFGAIGFRYLIGFIRTISYGAEGNLLEIIKGIPWYFRILIPTLGGLVVGPLVYFLAREAKGHGVPEVMNAVALKGGIIRKRVVIVKSLASAISIGTGGSVGREGPIVQIGSAIGSVIGQMLKISTERIRTLVGCGAAAGIAATFNAPIAGSMFALEIILGDFGLSTFSPIVISSVVATAVSRHFLGNSPAFNVPPYHLVSAWEFPFYVALGLFCALVAFCFIKILYKTEDLFDRFAFPEYLKAIVGGLLIGTIGLLFPHILGIGYETIDLALIEKLPWFIMLLLVFCKIMATSITIGSGGSGGIFAPSLFLGAMAGGFFGIVIHHFFPDISASPGAYAMVGMGAVVSGTTQGPLSAMLILFELTGDYKIILPLMITCIIAFLFSRHLSKESIYTMKLARRGINIYAGKEVNILKSLHVQDAMRKEIETIRENMPLGDLAHKISQSKYNSFPVVDEKEKLTGIISYIDYHDAVLEKDLERLIIAKDLATTEIVTVTSDDTLYDALEKISAKDLAILPVVAPHDPAALLGVLSRRDILRAYNGAVMRKSAL